MVYHPRVNVFFLWIVSYPGSVSLLFLGWCPILVDVPFCSWIVSYPVSMFFLWIVSYPVSWHRELQEDLLGTKVKKVLLAFTYIYNLSLHWCPKISVTAPELQEELGLVQLLVMSIKYISQFLMSPKIRSLVP